MRLIYAQGFSKSEKLEWKPVIFNNVVQSMRVIFDAMNDCHIEYENKENEVSSREGYLSTVILYYASETYPTVFVSPWAGNP